MADSRRKTNTIPSAAGQPIIIADEPAGGDETVGCLRITVLLAISLLFLVLIGTVGVFVAVQFDQKNSEKNAGGPIRPPDREGVTIALKQVDPAIQARQPAPIELGAKKAAGFAIDLGSATSFGELSARFAQIALQNAEIGFDRLEPRVTLKDTVDGLEARLLAGPFDSLAAATEICRNIALPAKAECQAVEFEGELIARE